MYLARRSCDGCGSQDKKVEFHRSRYGSGKYHCADSDTNNRDNYHLHVYCETCGYDWVTDTAEQADRA